MVDPRPNRVSQEEIDEAARRAVDTGDWSVVAALERRAAILERERTLAALRRAEERYDATPRGGSARLARLAAMFEDDVGVANEPTEAERAAREEAHRIMRRLQIARARFLVLRDEFLNDPPKRAAIYKLVTERDREIKTDQPWSEIQATIQRQTMWYADRLGLSLDDLDAIDGGWYRADALEDEREIRSVRAIPAGALDAIRARTDMTRRRGSETRTPARVQLGHRGRREQVPNAATARLSERCERVYNVVRMVRSSSGITSHEVQRRARLGRQAVLLALEDLVRDGRIERRGTGRNTRFLVTRM
jgi:hypothetical protein